MYELLFQDQYREHIISETYMINFFLSTRLTILRHFNLMSVIAVTEIKSFTKLFASMWLEAE